MKHLIVHGNDNGDGSVTAFTMCGLTGDAKDPEFHEWDPEQSDCIECLKIWDECEVPTDPFRVFHDTVVGMWGGANITGTRREPYDEKHFDAVCKFKALRWIVRQDGNQWSVAVGDISSQSHDGFIAALRGLKEANKGSKSIQQICARVEA